MRRHPAATRPRRDAHDLSTAQLAGGAILVFALALALACAPSSFAAEQTPAGSAPEATAAAGADPPADRSTARSRYFDPEDDRFDMSSFLENPRGFLPIPLLVTEPAVGYGGGAAGMFLRPRREAGEQGWARPDISAVGAVVTQNGTQAAFAGDSSRWFDGRLKTMAGAGTGRVNLDFYGLGDRAPLDQGIRYSLQFSGAVAQANWQLAKASPWSAGVRYVYAQVEPRLRDEPVFPGLVDRTGVRISAPTAVLEYDARDNILTPTRGLYSETSYMASRRALGATQDFERFEQVLLGWHPASRNVTLGARGNYAWSSNDTPFFMRPFVTLRGVPAMRYQGEQAAFTELEARWQFQGRWSFVAFGGAGATRTDRPSSPMSQRPASSITQSVFSGGVGFRYELARKFGLHAGIDLAHSPGTTAIYFQVGNAWFRP
jgi:hypothetical protein